MVPDPGNRLESKLGSDSGHEGLTLNTMARTGRAGKAAAGRLLYHERRARSDGFRAIAGVDESGRGPLAGPVVAAAVILRDKRFSCRIDDSKKLTASMRLVAFPEIARKAACGIGIVDERVVDEINIYRATGLAMVRAVAALSERPDCLLIDGRVALKISCEQRCIVGGDGLSLSIAAASIVAKVIRDSIMSMYHCIYPRYGFERHKGYGTKRHVRAIRRYGPSPVHRMTFAPIRNGEEEAACSRI